MSAPGPWRDAAPAPRGSYPPLIARVPPPPTMPMPMHSHSYASAGGQAYYTAPLPGFYSPSLAQPAPGLLPGRGAPAPSFPRPELPPSLVPGRKPTFSITRSQSDDYFFQPARPVHHSRQASTSPAPPIPRKPEEASRPQLPPQPAITPSAPSPPRTPPFSFGRISRPPAQRRSEDTLRPSAPPRPQLSDFDDVVLNQVIDISVREVERTKELERHREQARLAEEEQLAQALEASLRIEPPELGAGNASNGRSSVITPSPEQGPSTAPAHSPVFDIKLDAHGIFDADRSSQGSHVAQQILDDEALALQLAQEEERLAEQERLRAHATRSRSSSQLNSQGGPPQYAEAVSATSPGSSLAPQPMQPVARPLRSGSPMPPLGRSSSDKPTPPKRTTPEKTMSRSQSVGDVTPSASSTVLAPKPQTHRSSSFASSDYDTEDSTATASSPPADAPPRQYVDAELLLGLSLGFGMPAITPVPKPFTDVIPNVIALPYGKCPPFHIMAPSWRTLLRLMARLSGTRLEPTVEAMAVVKTEMRLRIVVSFVKVHHASSDWYTVLYMTIDHPIPPSAPAGWKFRNGDTSTLPWSYTLAQLPAFLRDGADAALSKFYTIPCTPDTPFPTLPISFPNLATYLAAALENSRDAMHDSSSGVRRLAKYVDQFYPSDRVVLDDAPERTGMRRRLKNLVGIGNRPARDRNAEMYELVTPFVPDDFGR